MELTEVCRSKHAVKIPVPNSCHAYFMLFINAIATVTKWAYISAFVPAFSFWTRYFPVFLFLFF